MLGINLFSSRSQMSTHYLTKISIKTLLVLGLLVCASASWAADVYTIQPQYLPGESAEIEGVTFWPGEPVSLQVTQLDGTVLSGSGGLPWTVATTELGSFATSWSVEWEYSGDELLVTAIGEESGETATTAFLAPQRSFDHLQNGTSTSGAEWANGNINGNNSCYSEGSVIAYRYFVKELDAGTEHFFTVEMEWTKGGIHALDYLVDYDLTEATPISNTGGICGTISNSPPPGCSSPTVSYPYSDFLNTTNYSGTIPPDFFTTVNPLFILDQAGSMQAYNVTIDSLGKYAFGGTASDRTLNFIVYFTVDTTGSVGFFWGGHLAESNSDSWRTGLGSSSVSGAPYHMRAASFDGGGLAGTDRSIQNSVICLPPSTGIISNSPSVCDIGNTVYVCRDTASGANTWLWDIVNGTIVGADNEDSVMFTVDAGVVAGDYITVSVESCDSSSGCPGQSCCSNDLITIPVEGCNNPPTVTCATDVSLFVCDLSEICIPGFFCNDSDGNLVSCDVSLGTLTGDVVCFTPTGSGVYTIQLVATDSFGEADTCVTNVTVTVNTAPTASCPGDQNMFVCDLSPITISGFACADVDGNLTDCSVDNGTLVGSDVTFTPVAGANVITLTATDACGATTTCQTTITVSVNSAPTASCPGDQNMFVCDLSPITISGFACADTDGNLTDCSVDNGTLVGADVTFTPIVGANVITLTATDACGETATCQTTITVAMNSDPTASCPGDQNMFVCDLSPITISGFSCADADDNLTDCSVDNGTLAGSDVTFTPVVGANVITLTATDACGETATCQTTITVAMNSDPTASCPGDQNMFVCDLSPIALPGFVCDDSDGNLTDCSVDNGTLAGDIVTFTPVAGVNTITLTATDACGRTSICQTTVTITVNTGPTAACPGDENRFVCDLSPITLTGFACDDIDGNLTDCSVDNGTLAGSDVTFTPVEGANVITLTATDACGETATCQTTITISLNAAPTATCPGDMNMTVCDLSDICIDGFTCDDVDGNLTTCVVDNGVLNGSEVCFTPVEGLNTITLTATDDCGATVSCEANITITLIPTMEMSDVSYDVALCQTGDVCVDLPTLSGGLAPFSWTFDGRAVSDTVCFALSANASISGVVEVTDGCGNSVTATLTVNAIVNSAPVVTAAPPSAMFICNPAGDSIIVQLTIVDPDNGLSGTSQLGIVDMTDSTVRFAATTAGQYCDVVVISDSCGLSSTVEYCIDVTINRAPVCDINIPTSVSACDPAQVCYPVNATDADGNLVSCEKVSGPGTLVNGNWCYTPAGDESVTVTFRCTDACGAFCEETYTIDFDYNEPAVANCPGYILIEMGTLGEICIPGFSCEDPDLGASGCGISGAPGITLSDGEVCFTPTAFGVYTLTLIAADECEADTCQTIVDVVQVFDCPIIKIEKTHNTPQGQFETVSIFLENGIKQMGGFDFLIAYDASALTFIEAVPGQLLADCGWEYFTYRFGAHGNCGDACPSGLLRIIALAEINNGPWHPSCYSPPDASGQYLLAEMNFYVSNDRTLNGMYVPIKFFWGDCGDNSIASMAGDTLYLDHIIYDFEGNLIWDEEDDDQFPEDDRIPFVGAVDYCMLGDKVYPVRCGEFWNGGIDIVHRDSIDAAGDINMNGVPNEIADAVMLTNFFISGLSVFGNHVEGSIAASDVNSDGTVLSIADLVYLVRVIIGDALPYPKPIADGMVALNTGKSDGLFEINYESPSNNGAILLVLNYQGTVGEPILGEIASGMDIISSTDGTTMRILIYNIGSNSISSGAGQLVSIPFDGSINLIEVEAADYYGSMIETTVRSLPETFALHQNYPNPFNPSTAIRMALGESSEWSITIYNIAGQKIKEYQGYSEAGMVEVIWDGLDESGRMVASGIYLYKASANKFTSTRQMILMK